MTSDHSLTYTKFRIRNIPHVIRLRNTLKLLKNLGLKPNESLLDVGCSNGYVTNVIKRRFDLSRVTGVDFDLKNIDLAKIKYPEITFFKGDINFGIEGKETFDYVLCLETIEHAGCLNSTLRNLLKPGNIPQTVIISVPIEVGFVGIIKFIIKNNFYGDDFSEIAVDKYQYFKTLFTGDKISKFRDNRPFWSTHYGFDYRDIIQIINDIKIQYKIIKKFSTVYFVIKVVPIQQVGD